MARRKKTSQNQLLEDILEAIVHPFYIINVKDYTIEMANSAAKQMADTKNTTCYALLHKMDKPCTNNHWPCPLEIIKKTKKPVRVEHIMYDKDDNPRNIEIFGYPIFDKEGNVKQIIEYNIDITERQKANEELRKLHNQLRIEKQKLEQILSIDQRLRSILDMNHLVDFVVDKTTEILEAKKCSLML